MRCRYCNQRLNLFKSLAGSSFCSQEHKKLYEEAEANKGFERLLQFVEKDGKPSASPAKPATPPPVAQPAIPQEKPAPPLEPQTVAGKAEKAVDSAPEPPMAGFLLDPIASCAETASSLAGASFGIPESSFPPEPPSLPSWRFEIATADLQQPASEVIEEEPVSSPDVPESDSVASLSPPEQPALASPGGRDSSPPPLASWLNYSFGEIDDAKQSIEVPSVGPVRPRAIALEVPSTETRPLAVGAPSFLSSSDTRGLQPSIQAMGDSRDFTNLARLNPLFREVRTANENVQYITPPAPPLQALGTLGVGAVQGRLIAGVQDAPASSQPAVFPPRLKYQAPAWQWPAEQPGVAGLPRRAFANLKLDQGDSSTAVAMNGAMTRIGLARAVRQPQAPGSRLVSTLGPGENLNRVVVDLQNTPSPPAYAISSARLSQSDCVVPAVESTAPESAAGVAPVITPINLTIRVSDTAVASGITDVTKPATVSGPLCLPDVPASRPTVTIDISRAAHKVLAQVQAKDGSKGCAISPARQTLRDCLRPAILWTTEAWLRRAVASVGWFHESDCAGKVFLSGAPAARLFSVRFAPESLPMDLLAIAFDRTVRRLELDVCQWKGELAGTEKEAQRLAVPRPSATSPLSLVALPQPCVTPVAARNVANLNQFTPIANPAKKGTAPSAAASASADEHDAMMALPQFTGAGPSFEFRLSSNGALKSPPSELADRKNTAAASDLRPSPLRVQPASMLVLPELSIPVRSVKWGASGKWATVISSSLPKQDEVQVSSSLRGLADALRVDPAVVRESATLRLNPRRPAISLDLGVQTSVHGVAAASALPRRRGPQLPVPVAPVDGLIVSGR